MRKMAAALALGLALTGCAGTAQQTSTTTTVATDTTPTLVTPTEVDITMTAIRLVKEAGLTGRATEATIWSTSQALVGDVHRPTDIPGVEWVGDVTVDTYPSADARDAYVEFARSNGSVLYAGHSHNTYWTVVKDQGTLADAKAVAEALSK